MNWALIPFDWNQARAFLATAEEGSLSAASRELGLTQPTLSRQVAALEQSLGVTLFERIGRSLALTDAGRDLLDHFRDMGEAAHRASLAAQGQAQGIEGTVRITSTNTLATYHLTPILAELRREAPGLELEVITSNQTRDLMRREADIAIRHARPEQPDLIAKLIGESEVGFYAAKSYLDKIGRPRTKDDLAHADFIGFETAELMLPTLQEMGLPLRRENFRISTDSGTVMLELMRQNLGISFMLKEDAELFDDIELVLADLAPIPVPIWLVTHRELHTSRRIRLVFDFIARSMGKRDDGNTAKQDLGDSWTVPLD